MKNILKQISVAAFCLMVFACGGTHSNYQAVPHFKVGGPYRIAGKVYKPKVEPLYTERGMASWYGDEFHMRHTANGEVFHKGDLTAAHRTLPLPSIVRVTNMANNKSVILRVNDRGPFAKSRIIDVSETAAKLLDFKIKGTATVQVELLHKESMDALSTVKIKPNELAEMKMQYELAQEKKTRNTVSPYAKNATPAKANKGIKPATKGAAVTTAQAPVRKMIGSKIVAGTYSNPKIASAQSATLKKNFSTKIEQIRVDGTNPYRLIIGGIKNADEAKTLITKLKALGFKNARLE